MFNYKVKLFLTIFMLLIVTGCGSSDDQIVIYSSMEDFKNVELTKQLEENFPDKDIIIQYYPTGNNAAKIRSEGTSTEADIVLALETMYLEELKDSFEDLDSFDTGHYLENVNPNHNKYLIFEKYSGTIAINKEFFDEEKIPYPKTYEDLLNPVFKNKVAMPNPKTSGTGYLFVINAINEMGETNAFEYFDQLSNNVKQFTASGSTPINLLIQGEVEIAMGLVSLAVNEINQGAKIELIELESGTPYNTSGLGIVKGKLEKEGVSEVFEFLMNEWLIFDKENYSPSNIIEGLEFNIENYPLDLIDADMTGIADLNYREKILAKWKY